MHAMDELTTTSSRSTGNDTGSPTNPSPPVVNHKRG
jgi:hypothetical protein